MEVVTTSAMPRAAAGAMGARGAMASFPLSSVAAVAEVTVELEVPCRDDDMNVDPCSDLVARQYERWPYPEPIHDLPAWLATNWEWFDPHHAHCMLWPGGRHAADLTILVAGCGTNQAAVFAYTNPNATVVGTDVSQSALRHHERMKRTYGLDNLELHRVPIEEVASLGGDFDLIVSTGVLHHLADPQLGANALAGCLRADGVLALMLYAHYGRIGVEMLASIFRDMGLTQDEASVALVTQAMAAVPVDHPVRSYLRLAPDLTYDAGLVDTFLHGRQRSFTVDDCLALVDAAGLAFQDWFLKSPYELGPTPEGGFLAAIGALPDAQRWSVLERLRPRNGAHFFTAVPRERPTASYRIDFAAPDAMDLVPSFRHRCGLERTEVVRPGWRLELDEAQCEVASQIDGHRSLRMIAEGVMAAGVGTVGSDGFVRDFVRMLWNRDVLAVRLPNASGAGAESPSWA